MRIKTFLGLLCSGQLPAMVGLSRLTTMSYRLRFLAAAGKLGLLASLRRGSVPFDRIAEALGTPPDRFEALEAWLGVGVRVGVLGLRSDGYYISDWLAVELSRPRSDALLAALEEAVAYHHTAISDIPAMLQSGRQFGLADQDSALIARSTLVIEPLLAEAIEDAVPSTGPFRVLEVGCGTGAYVRRAALRNPKVTVDAIELQPGAAELASSNLTRWGLDGRCSVSVQDVRAREPEPIYDLVTLHNNIYYFPRSERIELLAHARGFLRARGRLLLTTACAGGNPALAVLNAWFAASSIGGPLPLRDELTNQIRLAGFRDVESRALLPMDSLYAFGASNAGMSDAPAMSDPCAETMN
jgi:SAM-dependent methyltransferase